MKKKLQVFVSSTYEDMKAERQEAVEAILAAGHIPAGMELFASENEKQWKVIERWIKESDVFFIMLGGRYGSIETSSGKSYIHKEFEYAVSLRKPILSVLLSDTYIRRKEKDGIYNAYNPIETGDSRYIELKKAVTSKMSIVCDEVGKVGSAISRSFSNHEDEFNKCAGWISGSDYKKSINKISERYSGIVSASMGLNRDEAFRGLRDRAKKEIIIIGAGMSKLSKYALDSMEKQLMNVPIHLYMMDPKYIESHKGFATTVEDFFGIKNFKKFVRLSYDALCDFCNAHNSNPNCKNKITLSTYKTLPTLSMVLIDKDTKGGEMVVEYFTYRCGEERPLFSLKNGNKAYMYQSLLGNAYKLIEASESIIF